jgi:hypothetical protein
MRDQKKVTPFLGSLDHFSDRNKRVNIVVCADVDVALDLDEDADKDADDADGDGVGEGTVVRIPPFGSPVTTLLLL